MRGLCKGRRLWSTALPQRNWGALLAKLQDGKPLLLSPDELAKLKSTPKEQIAAALDEVGQEEQKHIVRISARSTN